MKTAAINVSWIALLKKTADAWVADKALRLSASLAYYSVFSIAPLLVITIGIAGLVLGDEAVAGKLYDQMKQYVGARSAEALQSMVESAAKPKEGIAATVTGFVVLLMGASGVFSALKDALNTIWEVKPKEGSGIMSFAREKFLNFGMVLVIGFLLLVSLLMTTLIANLHHELERVVALPGFVWSALAFVVSFAIEATLFAWIFKVLPDVRTRWRDVWMGAIMTALLFEIGKTGLSWYLGRESTENAYGAAGAIVLLLLWVYYASCILLFGAEFTQMHARFRGRIVAPAAGSEWATAADRQNEGMDHQGGSKAHATPQVAPGVAPSHSFGSPLLAPVLKYLEGRGLLLSLEAKEAFRQVLGLVVLLVVVLVALFAGWLLLAGALVELIVNLTGWSRLQATLATGGLHVLVAGLAGLWMWRRLSTARWFADSLNELRKDRLWLRGH